MSRVLAFEWRRAASLRSTWVFLALGMGLLVFIAWGPMIFNATPEATGGAVSLPDVAAFGGAAPLGLVLITTLCAQAFGHEYRDGTMRLVLSQFPARSRVFVAKILVPGLLVAAAVILACVLAVAGAMLIWGLDPDAGWPAVVGAAGRQVVLAVWWGLMVAGITALLRNLAAGIVVSLVLAAVLEPLLIGLLATLDEATGAQGSRAPWLTQNLPFTNALAWAAEADGRAAAVALAWVLLVVGSAWALFLRRDA